MTILPLYTKIENEREMIGKSDKREIEREREKERGGGVTRGKERGREN